MRKRKASLSLSTKAASGLIARTGNPSRWISWVQELRARWERIAYRRIGVPIILARSRVTELTQINRWERTVHAWFPKINLAISPMLVPRAERAAEWSFERQAQREFL